jgi:hypothetical protein
VARLPAGMASGAIVKLSIHKGAKINTVADQQRVHANALPEKAPVDIATSGIACRLRLYKTVLIKTQIPRNKNKMSRVSPIAAAPSPGGGAGHTFLLYRFSGIT